MLLQQRFRDAVLARLEVLGWNKAELARQMEVPPPYISQYLNGRNSPGLDVVERFAAALRIDASELLVPTEQRAAAKVR